VRARFLTAAFVLASAACAHDPPSRPFNAPAETHAARSAEGDLAFASTARDADARPLERGLATWYGKSFAGKRTASGERFDPSAMTAAHRKLAFGTWVEVRRVDTGSSVRVRITDRGPWGDPHKIIDLSRAAAERLGVVRDGVANVELRVVSGPE